MKKYIVLVVVLSFGVTIGCNSNQTKKAEQNQVQAENNQEKHYAQKINKQQFFEKVYNYEKNPQEWKFEGDLPVIVDFYADWCAPCRMVAPLLEELAKEYEGKIHIYKVDTQKERELSSAFGISGIPAFLIIPKEGKPMMHSGTARTPAETKEMFRQIIEEQLLGNKLNAEK